MHVLAELKAHPEHLPMVERWERNGVTAAEVFRELKRLDAQLDDLDLHVSLTGVKEHFTGVCRCTHHYGDH